MKILKVSTLALLLFSFTSCKKEYTCRCVTNVKGQTANSQEDLYTVKLKNNYYEAAGSCTSNSFTTDSTTRDCGLLEN